MNRARRITHSGRNIQAGVGLVEVMIALLVLSFGMLGLAGLQMRTLRNNQSSMERGMAVVQTHSIADMMRVDRASAITNGWDLAIDADPPDEDTYAATSLAAWRANLLAVLGPGATGSVDCNGAMCTIQVQWTERVRDADDRDDPEPLIITTEVQL